MFPRETCSFTPISILTYKLIWTGCPVLIYWYKFIYFLTCFYDGLTQYTFDFKVIIPSNIKTIQIWFHIPKIHFVTDKTFGSLKMSPLLLVLSVMMLCLSTLCAASKCDDKIIKQIKKKFWNNNRCTPRELFRKVSLKYNTLRRKNCEQYVCTS